MTSVKVKYRPSAVADREGTIYYQIIHDRKVRWLHTGHHVRAEEWDERRSIVISPDSEERGALIRSVRELVCRDVERLERIASRLKRSGMAYTAEDVAAEFERYTREYSLFNFMGTLIAKHRNNGRTRTSETYAAALKSIGKFLGGRDMMLDGITSERMEAYEAWLRGRGNSPNTISFYMRILRAVYNRAVEMEVIDNRHPFRHVYTGVDKTVKRFIPLIQVRRIRRLDLKAYPRLEYARDMFMLSFFLRGMSFIDMAFLKKTDLRNGYIIYRRRKTGQQLTIEWTREMQEIVDKYPSNRTDYLLPIIRKAGLNERCAYRNSGYNINRSLKSVADKAGIDIPLTMYVARHSWASAAKAKGVPLSVISEGMGHDRESTTRIYLASLDISVVDKANALILKSI